MSQQPLRAIGTLAVRSNCCLVWTPNQADAAGAIPYNRIPWRNRVTNYRLRHFCNYDVYKRKTFMQFRVTAYSRINARFCNQWFAHHSTGILLKKKVTFKYGIFSRGLSNITVNTKKTSHWNTKYEEHQRSSDRRSQLCLRCFIPATCFGHIMKASTGKTHKTHGSV
jgi:hypothetical protein